MHMYPYVHVLRADTCVHAYKPEYIYGDSTNQRNSLQLNVSLLERMKSNLSTVPTIRELDLRAKDSLVHVSTVFGQQHRDPRGCDGLKVSRRPTPLHPKE